MKVTFLYLDSADDEYGPVADTVLAMMKQSEVKVRATHTWHAIYHHGYMTNPFDNLVERTYRDTRSKHGLITYSY